MLSAKDALLKLKSKIVQSIRSTQEVILYSANCGNYDLAAKFQSEIEGRESVLYMIDEVLNELKTPS